jgi:hypothetical protein
MASPKSWGQAELFWRLQKVVALRTALPPLLSLSEASGGVGPREATIRDRRRQAVVAGDGPLVGGERQ